MKKAMLCAGLAVMLVAGYGCSGKKDSNEAAKDINEAKIEDKATANTDDESETDQINESTYLVDLANVGLTGYELSKLAVQRATNQEVKIYAQDVGKKYLAADKELQALTQPKKLTLPTTLSKDSQGMLADLTDEKPGADFDKKYLSQMADLNKQTTAKASGIRTNTQNTALQNFVTQVLADSKAQKEQLQKLQDAL